jgi:hypothetical protein
MRKFRAGVTNEYWAKLGKVNAISASELCKLKSGESAWVSVADFLRQYPEEDSFIWLVFGHSNCIVEIFPYIPRDEWPLYAIYLKKLF